MSNWVLFNMDMVQNWIYNSKTITSKYNTVLLKRKLRLMRLVVLGKPEILLQPPHFQ